MGMLRLAEAGSYLSASNIIADSYIKMPHPTTGQIISVRADLFDALPDDEFIEVMANLEPYNTHGITTMNGLSSWLAKRREARQTRIETRQAGKTERVKSGGGLANVIGNVAKGAAAIFGRGTTETEAAPDARGFQFQVGGGQTATPQKMWYENPVIIGGAVLSLGALVYFLTRKKSKS